MLTFDLTVSYRAARPSCAGRTFTSAAIGYACSVSTTSYTRYSARSVQTR
jgi:hypothetical protein